MSDSGMLSAQAASAAAPSGPRPAEMGTAIAPPANPRRGLLFVGLAALFFTTSPTLSRCSAMTLSPGELAAGHLLPAGDMVLSSACERARGEALPSVRRRPVLAPIDPTAVLHCGLYFASRNDTASAHAPAIILALS